MAAPRPSPARGQDAGRKSPSASPWFPTPACRQRGLHPPWRATREGIEGLRILLGEDTDDVSEAIQLIGRVRCCWPRGGAEAETLKPNGDGAVSARHHLTP